jgi:hypothetical protein
MPNPVGVRTSATCWRLAEKNGVSSAGNEMPTATGPLESIAPAGTGAARCHPCRSQQHHGANRGLLEPALQRKAYEDSPESEPKHPPWSETTLDSGK